MPDILHEVTIAAAPERVYAALTQQQGLRSWWTPLAIAEGKVGSVAEFTFSGGRFVVRMEINTLVPSRTVNWTVKAGFPDGTHITWDLTPAGNGTQVRFGHRDFASTDGVFATVNYNWGWYLTSLKDYLETGKGRPGQLHA